MVVYRLGGGSGVVTGSDLFGQVINCGLDCEQTYVTPTTVDLAAVPNAGSVFVGWSGSCSGTTPTCSVLAGGQGIEVYAEFEELFGLNVSKTGSGQGTVTGTRVDTGAQVVNCGGDCTDSSPSGTEIELTATPSSGSEFAGWEGACRGTANPCRLTLEDAASVVARFESSVTLTLIVVRDGPAWGGGIRAGIDGRPNSSSPTCTGGVCTIDVPRGATVWLRRFEDDQGLPVDVTRITSWGGACDDHGLAGEFCPFTVSSSTTREIRLEGRYTLTTVNREPNAYLVGGVADGTGYECEPDNCVECTATCRSYWWPDSPMYLHFLSYQVDQEVGSMGPYYWRQGCNDAGANARCRFTLQSDTTVEVARSQ